MYTKIQTPYIPAGFEPEVFCFGGGLDDHYATLPRLLFENQFT
jgi:hypothetical protein